jgi:hypothetical protein
MSWRELAWSGKMRRKRPDEESTGIVTSVGIAGAEIARPGAPKGRQAIAAPVQEGVQVTVDVLKSPEEHRVSPVGRMRLPR